MFGVLYLGSSNCFKCILCQFQMYFMLCLRKERAFMKTQQEVGVGVCWLVGSDDKLCASYANLHVRF